MSPKGDMEGKDGLNVNCRQEPAKVALPSVPKTVTGPCLPLPRLACQGTRSKSLELSEPRFPHLCNDDNDILQMAMALGRGLGHTQ